MKHSAIIILYLNSWLPKQHRHVQFNNPASLTSTDQLTAQVHFYSTGTFLLLRYISSLYIHHLLPKDTTNI